MDKEHLIELIEGKKPLLKADKDALIQAATSLELQCEINSKKRCAAYWEGLMLKVFETMTESEPQAVSKDGYKFKRKNTSFRLGGKVINELNINGIEVGGLNPIVRDTYFIKSDE